MLNRFKQLINLSLTDAPPQALDHPVLGYLAPEGDDQTLIGQVDYHARKVALRVSADDSVLHGALALAAQAVQALAAFDAKSRKLVSDASLKTYNEDWRCGTSLMADGSARGFEKPALSEQQFCEALELHTIETSGASCLTLWYVDGGMFWGRSHCVSWFDGLDMTDGRVSMTG